MLIETVECVTKTDILYNSHNTQIFIISQTNNNILFINTDTKTTKIKIYHRLSIL